MGHARILQPHKILIIAAFMQGGFLVSYHSIIVLPAKIIHNCSSFYRANISTRI